MLEEPNAWVIAQEIENVGGMIEMIKEANTHTPWGRFLSTWCLFIHIVNFPDMIKSSQLRLVVCPPIPVWCVFHLLNCVVISCTSSFYDLMPG